MQHQYTVTTIDSDTPTGKEITLVDGVINKKGINTLYKGVAHQHHPKDAEAMADLQKQISSDPNSTLVLGMFKGYPTDGSALNIVTEKALIELWQIDNGGEKYVSGRSIKGAYKHSDGLYYSSRLNHLMIASTWILIDIDTPSYMPEKQRDLIKRSTSRELLNLINPIFEDVEYVQCPSTSSRVWIPGHEGSANKHLYMQVNDPKNIKKFGDALFIDCLGTDAMFERVSEVANQRTYGAIFDKTTLNSTNRLAFTGTPTVTPPIKIVPYANKVIPGSVKVLDIKSFETSKALPNYEKVDRSKYDNTSRIVNKSLLSRMTMLEVKDRLVNNGSVTRMPFYEVEKIAKDNDEKIRVQMPFRDSKSYAGLVRSTGKESFLYDSGDGIHYKVDVNSEIKKQVASLKLKMNVKPAPPRPGVKQTFKPAPPRPGVKQTFKPAPPRPDVKQTFKPAPPRPTTRSTSIPHVNVMLDNMYNLLNELNIPDQFDEIDIARLLKERVFDNLAVLHIDPITQENYYWSGWGWQHIENVKLFESFVVHATSKMTTINYRKIINIAKLLQGYVAAKLSTERPSLLPNYLRVMQNGLLNTKTGKLESHNKTYFYIPNDRDFNDQVDTKGCLFDIALDVSFRNDPESRRKYLQMMSYYYFADTNYLEKGLFFDGVAGAGKSLGLKLVNSIAGSVSGTFSLHDILDGKTLLSVSNKAMVFDDDATKPKQDADKIAEMYNSITSRGHYSLSQLYTSVKKEGKWTGIMAFACNRLPRFTNVGFIRRLEVVEFKNVVTGTKYEKNNILSTILDSRHETSCVIAMLWAAFKDIFEENGNVFGDWNQVKFHYVESVDKLIKREITSAQRGTLMDFVDDKLIYNPDAFVTNSQLYKAIRDYEPGCRNKSTQSLAFMLRLALSGTEMASLESEVTTQNGQSVRGYRGIKLKIFENI